MLLHLVVGHVVLEELRLVLKRSNLRLGVAGLCGGNLGRDKKGDGDDGGDLTMAVANR